MKKIVLGITGVVFLAALAVWVRTGRATENASRAERELQSRLAVSEARIQQLEESVAQTNRTTNAAIHNLRGAVQVVSPQSSSAQAGDLTAKTSSPTNALAAAQAAGQQPMDSARREEEIRNRMDAKFAAEQRDAQWGTSTAAGLRQDFTTHLPKNARMDDLDCRQTLCKVETTFQDMTSYREFVSTKLMGGPVKWDGQGLASVRRTERNGEVVVVTYLTRPGYLANYAGEDDE